MGIPALFRRALAPLGFGAVAVIVAGCTPATSGSSSAVGTPPQGTQPPTVAAYDAVTAAGAATAATKIHVDITATATAAGDVHASGDFDLSAASGTLTVDPGGGQTVNVVYSGDNVYLHPPASATQGGKPWQLFNATDANAHASDQVIEAVALDPGFLITELVSAASSASPAGTGSVGGAPVTLYDVSIDVRRARNDLSGPGAALYGQGALGQQRGAGNGNQNSAQVTVRVAVDGSGHIVSIVADQSGVRAGTDTFVFSAVAAPLSLQLPPADQVVDVGNSSTAGEHEVHSEGDGAGS